MAATLGMGLVPSKTALGAFIRQRRLELKLTQGQLGGLTGFSQAEISVLEVGKIKGKNEQLIKELAKALQCDLARLEQFLPKKPDCEPKTELGILIRSRRKALGLTRKDLAAIIKAKPLTIYWWETGRGLRISYDLAKPLAEALGLELSALSEFVGRQDKRSKKTLSGLGKLIRQRRKKLALSGPVLAKNLTISKQFLSLIELGDCYCSAKLLKKMAGELKLDLACLQAAQPPAKIRPPKKNRSLKKFRRRPPLGKFILNRRQMLGLTQLKAAAQIGMSNCELSLIETGKHRPWRQTLTKIARALKCEIPAEFWPRPENPC